ncbi:MAG: hypothetical protein H6907_00825 [Hyphomicrobiales bacterium]|nr:hypothetical protein [Hyphomicrobiales bacterium]MCP5370248.1 hypothetical protein [Hyphomicrobiales bacterium]
MDGNPLLIVHLLCATLFFGIVAFEVLILEGIRPFLPAATMTLVEQGIHTRGRKVMPWVVGLLFASGIAMAVLHFDAMDWKVWHTSFGVLLTVKIALALSVLVHFLLALKHSICGSMTSKRFKYTHLSVFAHMVAILVLAKSLYGVGW